MDIFSEQELEQLRYAVGSLRMSSNSSTCSKFPICTIAGSPRGIMSSPKMQRRSMWPIPQSRREKGFLDAMLTVISPHVQLTVQDAVSSVELSKRKQFYTLVSALPFTHGLSTGAAILPMDWISRPFPGPWFCRFSENARHPGRSRVDPRRSISNQLVRNHSIA